MGAARLLCEKQLDRKPGFVLNDDLSVSVRRRTAHATSGTRRVRICPIRVLLLVGFT